MKTIPLTKGYSTIVDDEDYELLVQHKWHVQLWKNRKGEISIVYAVSTWYDENRKLHTIYMHRKVLGITERSIIVDHVDHDGLNNCKGNLRSCTRGDNVRNARKPIDNTSGHKGVTWNPKAGGKWYAQIHYKGKHYHLGVFPGDDAGKLEAAKAYEDAAVRLYAGFACFDKAGTAIEGGSSN